LPLFATLGSRLTSRSLFEHDYSLPRHGTVRTQKAGALPTLHPRPAYVFLHLLAYPSPVRSIIIHLPCLSGRDHARGRTKGQLISERIPNTPYSKDCIACALIRPRQAEISQRGGLLELRDDMSVANVRSYNMYQERGINRLLAASKHLRKAKVSTQKKKKSRPW
jgi:hypothetical protein